MGIFGFRQGFLENRYGCCKVGLVTTTQQEEIASLEPGAAIVDLNVHLCSHFAPITTTALCDSVVRHIELYTRVAQNLSRVIPVIICLDRREFLSIKPTMRDARTSWQREYASRLGSATARGYPESALFDDFGVRSNVGERSQLLDVKMLMQSSKTVYSRFVALLQKSIMAAASLRFSRVMLVLDLGNGAPLTAVFGKDVHLPDIPLPPQVAYALTIFRKNAAAGKHIPSDGVFSCVMPLGETLACNAVESDMRMLYWIKIMSTSAFWDAANHPLVFDTTDTDAVAVFISALGQNKSRSSRDVFWWAAHRRSWNISKVKRQIEQEKPLSVQAAIIPFAMLCGCDYFKHEWLTEGISVDDIWDSFDILWRTEEFKEWEHEPVHWLDWIQRHVVAHKVGVYNPTSTAVITVPTWEQLQAFCSKLPTPKRARGEDSVDSKRKRRCTVPNKLTTAKFLVRAVTFCKVLTYWKTVGERDSVSAIQQRSLDRFKGQFHRQTIPSSRSITLSGPAKQQVVPE